MLTTTHRMAHCTTLPGYVASVAGQCTSVCDELRSYVRHALRTLSSRERALLARYFDSGMVGGRDAARLRMAADLGVTLEELHTRMDALREQVAERVRQLAYSAG